MSDQTERYYLPDRGAHEKLVAALERKQSELFVPQLPEGFSTAGWEVPFHLIKRGAGDAQRPLWANDHLFQITIFYRLGELEYYDTVHTNFTAYVVTERARGQCYDLVLEAVARLRRRAGVIV